MKPRTTVELDAESLAVIVLDYLSRTRQFRSSEARLLFIGGAGGLKCVVEYEPEGGEECN